jgi:hypothetical protein
MTERPKREYYGREYHGHACKDKKTPEYQAWINMKKRCNDLKHCNYGKRGIKVCERWNCSFINFLADMGEKPSAKHSLERIDNNGDYTPENCKWETWKNQCLNTRKAITFIVNDKPMSEGDLSKRYGINRGSLQYWRIKQGLSNKEIVDKAKYLWKEAINGAT